jgi:hypothetical protein
MLKYIITLVFLVGVLEANSQNRSSFLTAVFRPVQKCEIVEVKVIDPFFLNKLDSLIDSNMKNDLFRSLGVVKVFLEKRGYKFSDTTRYRFCLSIIWNSVLNRITDTNAQFPDYYFIRKNKLIEIYSRDYDEYLDQNFSMRSKKKFVRLEWKYSPRPKPIKVVLGGRKQKGYYDPNDMFFHGPELIVSYPEGRAPFTIIRKY